MEPNALTPISDWLTQVIGPVLFLFLAFCLGTVQFTELIKIVVPKNKKAEAVAAWIEWRPKILKMISVLVGMIGPVAFGADFLAAFDTINLLFGLDPMITSVVSGLSVSLGANLIYDKWFDVKKDSPK